MLKTVLVLLATAVMVAAGDPVGPQPLLTMDQGCNSIDILNLRLEFRRNNPWAQLNTGHSPVEHQK